MKTKIELISKEIGTNEQTILHTTDVDMFLIPRIGEHIIFKGGAYIVMDVIHDYDSNTLEVHLIDIGVW